MSLNGLDAPQVKEAYDAAVAEPGGWFILQYAGRDAVELLGRGNGGIVEIRNAIAQYEEPSPLYGFLRYRRRSVIIKYLPDNCSRLVQARMSVHLDSVCERFSPHDTVFTISAARELKDTKLSTACSLHAASGSTSSSTSSLRRRRLMEIAEEEEEEIRANKRQSIVDEETDRPRQTVAADVSVTLDSGLASSPEESQFAGTAEPPAFVGIPRPASPAKSLDAAGDSSLQSGRPDLHGYLSSTSLSTRPKVKLGPRPSLDIGGRPRTALGSTFRPISTIPAGFKMLSKTGKNKSQGATEESAETEPESPPSASSTQPTLSHMAEAASLTDLASTTNGTPTPDFDTLLVRPHTSGGRSTIIAGNKAHIKLPLSPGLPSASVRPLPASQNVISLEKSRLMKAMQLREKKKQEALRAATGPATSAVVNGAISLTRESIVSPGEVGFEQADTNFNAHDRDTNNPGLENEGGLLPSDSKTYSTDDAASFLPPDRASLDAQTDSHPPSPLAAPSEIGNSTKASSVSESTDENALERKGQEARSRANDQECNVDVLSEVVDCVADIRPSTAIPDDDRLVIPKSEQKRGGNDASFSAAISAPGGLSAEDGANGVDANSATSMATTEGSFRMVIEERGGDSSHISQETNLDACCTSVQTSSSSHPQQDSNSGIQYPSLLGTSTAADDTADGMNGGWKPVTSVVGLDLDQGQSDAGQSRRKAAIEPVRTDLVVTDPRNMSDDEDLTDELRLATLEEVKPTLVSKSPTTTALQSGGVSCPFNNTDSLSPGLKADQAAATHQGLGSTEVFARPTSATETSLAGRGGIRAVSNPSSRGPSLTVGDASQSSVSRAASSGASFLHRLTQQPSLPSSQSAASNLLAKKSSVGSSISQRIKALEKLSSASGVPPSSITERPQSTFFSVRQPSVREPSRSPSVAERASYLGKENTPSPPRSRDRDPPVTAGGLRERSGSISSRLSVFEGGSLPRGRPESVQVTARIVRDPFQPFNRAVEPRADATDPAFLDLKQSPLVVDHQKASMRTAEALPVTVEPKQATIQQRRLSRDKRRSQSTDDGATADATGEEGINGDGSRPRRRSSLTIMKDFIKERRSSLLGAKSSSTDNLNLGPTATPSPTPSTSVAQAPSRSPSRPPSTHHNSVFPRRLSVSSRRSSVSRDREGPATPLLSPGPMAETSGSGDEGLGRLTSDAGQKAAGVSCNNSGGSGGKSRASRFIRRLSNSLSSSRKTVTPAISPTVAEEVVDGGLGSAVDTSGCGPGAQQPSQPAMVRYMGDVNVQFPDNLLWKRRTMCLDSHGFLILSTAQGVAATTNAAVGLSVGRDRQGAGGLIKRYHLSDFRMPYAPEIEQQELPNSVCLDFVDGSSLQIACEDRSGQLNILDALQEIHRSHTTFGQ